MADGTWHVEEESKSPPVSLSGVLSKVCGVTGVELLYCTINGSAPSAEFDILLLRSTNVYLHIRDVG